jgi:asparagine synthetase B (glutamine-hydrolysing)
MSAVDVVPAEGSIAVLTSGGVDSAILVGELVRQERVVHPIYVRFGLV